MMVGSCYRHLNHRRSPLPENLQKLGIYDKIMMDEVPMSESVNQGRTHEGIAQFLQLYDLNMELAQAGVRMEHPQASPEEVQQLLAMDLQMPPSEDLAAKAVQVVDFLNREGIEYALTGGMALAFWGYPRSTIDVDIILAVSLENYRQLKLSRSLPFMMEPDELTLPHMKVCRGLMPTSSSQVVIIDLLVVDEAWSLSIIQRRLQATLRGRPIWVSSVEDIILLKLFSPRVKDQEDIRMLMQLRKDRLDTAYITEWSRRLGTVVRWISLFSLGGRGVGGEGGHETGPRQHTDES
jgi:hypothetical protein